MLLDMGVGADTLYRNPMVKFLLWTIYFHNFESDLFDRELSMKKRFFIAGLSRPSGQGQ